MQCPVSSMYTPPNMFHSMWQGCGKPVEARCNTSSSNDDRKSIKPRAASSRYAADVETPWGHYGVCFASVCFSKYRGSPSKVRQKLDAIYPNAGSDVEAADDFAPTNVCDVVRPASAKPNHKTYQNRMRLLPSCHPFSQTTVRTCRRRKTPIHQLPSHGRLRPVT